jgi:hypothetical protein
VCVLSGSVVGWKGRHRQLRRHPMYEQSPRSLYCKQAKLPKAKFILVFNTKYGRQYRYDNTTRNFREREGNNNCRNKLFLNKRCRLYQLHCNYVPPSDSESSSLSNGKRLWLFRAKCPGNDCIRTDLGYTVGCLRKQGRIRRQRRSNN